MQWLARVGTQGQDKEILFTLTWHINIRGSVSPCSGLYSIVCQANEQACSNNSPTKESLACGNGTCDTFMRMSFVSQMNLHEKKDAEKTFHDDIWWGSCLGFFCLGFYWAVMTWPEHICDVITRGGGVSTRGTHGGLMFDHKLDWMKTCLSVDTLLLYELWSEKASYLFNTCDMAWNAQTNLKCTFSEKHSRLSVS